MIRKEIIETADRLRKEHKEIYDLLANETIAKKRIKDRMEKDLLKE